MDPACLGRRHYRSTPTCRWAGRRPAVRPPIQGSRSGSPTQTASRLSRDGGGMVDGWPVGLVFGTSVSFSLFLRTVLAQHIGGGGLGTASEWRWLPGTSDGARESCISLWISVRVTPHR